MILAGGQGTRLRPYTVTLPKPLVPVGDRPIIEILLGQLVRDGFSRIIIAVGHMAGLIEAYCGDGSRWGVSIEYAREAEPLGTAGPLAELAPRLPEAFLVLNGDVLCDVNFGDFLDAHEQHPDAPLLTVSTHRRVLCSDYGVLESDRHGRITAYHEKPTYDLDVSEGVYAFSRTAAEWIPSGAKIDFPDLVSTLLIHQQTIIAREHRGIWLDIGRPDDYERAQELIAEYADRFPSPPVGAAATERRPVGKPV
ncbi:MAG: nucleotidyltransferase family protein [Candidatus Zixiibacteriota bacterium]